MTVNGYPSPPLAEGFLIHVMHTVAFLSIIEHF